MLMINLLASKLPLISERIRNNSHDYIAILTKFSRPYSPGQLPSPYPIQSPSQLLSPGMAPLGIKRLDSFKLDSNHSAFCS